LLKIKEIESLDFSNFFHDVDQSVVESFKTFEVNNSLKELNLTNVRLDAKHFSKLFNYLKNYENLEMLSLQGSNLTCKLMLKLLIMMKKKKFKMLSKVNFFGIKSTKIM
jgi:hypothetical protein